MNSGLRFSLVLACLSDPKTVANTLSHIGNQTYPKADFEVILVDDASPISLESVVVQFANNLGILAHFIRNEPNLGRAKSRNKGIQAATGEIVVFFDDDQILEPDFLDELDKAFGEVPEQSIRANTAVLPSLLTGSAFLRYYDSRFLGKRTPVELASIDINNLPAKYYAAGGMATGRRSLLAVGAFDQTFKYYGGEDEELGARLEEAKINLSLCLTARVYCSDDNLTVSRACDRTIEYARASVPNILRLHPHYVRQLSLWFLELPAPELSLKLRLARTLLTKTFRFWIARQLCNFLEKRDRRPGFNPSQSAYKLALLGYYLQGMRVRSSERD